MQKFITRHSIIRIISLFLFPVLLGLSLILEDGIQPFSINVCLISSSALMLVYPTSAGDVKLSCRFAIAGTLLMLLMFIFRIEQSLLIIICLAYVLTYCVIAGINCTANILERFRVSLAWKSMEIYSKMFYMVLYFFLCAVSLWRGGDAAAWIETGFSVLLLAALHIRGYWAVTLFFPRSLEKQVRRLLRSDIRALTNMGTKSESKLEKVYSRTLDAVETKQLYLRYKFTLNDLAHEVYCNKTFLSRAINVYAGTNFCGFMNAYRVAYAKELLEKDPRMLKKEVALMSGFQNVVTFNFAFKELTGSTPTEYAERIKLDTKKRLSSSGEPGR